MNENYTTRHVWENILKKLLFFAYGIKWVTANIVPHIKIIGEQHSIHFMTLSDGLMDYHHFRTNICSVNPLQSTRLFRGVFLEPITGSKQRAHIFSLLLIIQTWLMTAKLTLTSRSKIDGSDNLHIQMNFMYCCCASRYWVQITGLEHLLIN